MISIGTPVRSDRSLAAVSAPRRADRNTGLVELFAIIAIRIGFGPAAAAVPAEPSPGAAGFDFGQPAAASAANNVAITARRTVFILVFPPRQPSRREPRARLIEHHRDHDGATDDDPLVVLIEVQRPDGLSNEDNEHRSQHRVYRASPTAAQTSTAHDRGRDHV